MSESDVNMWRKSFGLPEVSDPVNHPSHYTSGKIEVADFIADQGLDFFLGNVVKYISRAGKKDPDKFIEDLKKARWYLDYKINENSETPAEEKKQKFQTFLFRPNVFGTQHVCQTCWKEVPLGQEADHIRTEHLLKGDNNGKDVSSDSGERTEST